MAKTVFITGITGQDGAYLAKLLLEKGYKVYGGYRRLSTPNFWRIEELAIKDKISLLEVDLLDSGNLIRTLNETKPDEVYNLAAQSFVAVSFEKPVLTGQVTALGVTNLLEAVRIVNTKIKLYQASSSEMFGKVQEIPQKETTPFYPRSPYAVAKLYGHWITINYRESFNIFACSGILFNHESPLRGIEFVTRKITDAAVRIKTGKQDCLEIGNLDAKRDWGFAGDYVRSIWMMLQQNKPEDFVIATGEAHSVREFIEQAFQHAGFYIEWRGTGVDEKGIDRKSGKVLIKINPKFFRPAEVEFLCGDSSRAREKLGWKPEVTFSELVQMMVQSDLKRMEKNNN
ncbi:MAG: GDP-mannose 4,6-dehydratase [Spirochaetes bacterium]|nr:GDP-mannose 4,6-dehydratase [Spirochaetota bacterium]